MASSKTSRTADQQVCIAQFGAPQGVRGLIRLNSFAEDPAMLLDYAPLKDESGRAYDLKLQGMRKNQLIVAVDGVSDRTAAEALTNVKLYVTRDQLPAAAPGEYYLTDLIDLKACNNDGQDLGTIRAVHNFGAGDILEVALKDGSEEMVPFNDDCVPAVDLEAGIVTLNLPEVIEAEEERGT